jgi:transmembrane sensor
MAEPISELDLALPQVQAAWDEQRTERTLSALHRKRASRRRRGLGLSASVLAVALAGAGWWLGASRAPDVQEAAAAKLPAPGGSAANERRIQFADGSHVELLDADARIVVSEVSPLLSSVVMPSGRARFEVVPNPLRAFEVSSGEVVVQVLGTSFELAREGARTHVKVLRGRVAVRWNTGESELAPGEAGWFPPSGEAAASDRLGGRRAHAVRKRANGAARGWREHAEDGDFGRAYELLQHAEQPVADDVQELLLAADAARLSGHPAQAEPFLRRVMERHASDPRASLAAFTLGGVLMNQLGRPREAEAAYARARALSLSDALAQDAVARQVEAAHRAGDTTRARKLALQYLDRYPNGRRVNAVRRFGGLQ